MIPLQDVPVMVLHVVNSDTVYGQINVRHDSVTRHPCDGFACTVVIYGQINFKTSNMIPLQDVPVMVLRVVIYGHIKLL